MILKVSKLLHLLNRGISGNRIISSLSGSHSGGFPENHLAVRLLAGYMEDRGSISLPPYQPVIGKAVIFASSIMTLPLTVSEIIRSQSGENGFTNFCTAVFSFSSIGGIIVYIVLIILFTFFYSYVQLNPNRISVDFMKSGRFIIGVKIGKDTEKYISDAALAYNDIIAINLPSNNKYFSLDEQNAFYDYHKTRVLYVPKQSTYKIPLTVQYVPDHIFANQIFEEIVIPPACSSVGYGSFRNCNNLKKIIITGNIYSWKDDSLSSLSSLELIEYFQKKV